MRKIRDLEILAMLYVLTDMDKFAGSIGQSITGFYNPKYKFKEARKINNLKYIRNPVYSKITKFPGFFIDFHRKAC